MAILLKGHSCPVSLTGAGLRRIHAQSDVKAVLKLAGRPPAVEHAHTRPNGCFQNQPHEWVVRGGAGLFESLKGREPFGLGRTARSYRDFPVSPVGKQGAGSQAVDPASCTHCKSQNWLLLPVCPRASRASCWTQARGLGEHGLLPPRTEAPNFRSH